MRRFALVQNSYITNMPKSAPHRLHEAISVLIRVYKITETGTTGSRGKKHLNPVDMQTLLFVGDRTDCIANDVAQHLRIAPTTASSVIDRLVRKGLLLRKRTEENRRVVRLRLTEAGRNVHDRLLDYQLTNCRAMLAALEPGEQETFLKLISIIAAKVSRSRPPVSAE